MEKDTVKEERKNNKVVLLILGVATVLVALVGATFAYFTATVNAEKTQSVTVTTAKIEGVIYTASDPISLLNVIPGASAHATFTIKNPNASATALYSMDLITDANNFVTDDGENQLIVTVTGGKITGSKTFDMTDGSNTAPRNIVTKVQLGAGLTDEYTINIEFVNFPDKAQDTNQDKTYVGHIDVTQTVETIVEP